MWKCGNENGFENSSAGPHWGKLYFDKFSIGPRKKGLSCFCIKVDQVVEKICLGWDTQFFT